MGGGGCPPRSSVALQQQVMRKECASIRALGIPIITTRMHDDWRHGKFPMQNNLGVHTYSDAVIGYYRSLTNTDHILAIWSLRHVDAWIQDCPGQYPVTIKY